jgi:predicted AAA+ superfamily ATPase
VTLIDRPAYLDLMVGYLDKPVIKVLAGMRRSGKSSLLALLAARLEDRGVPPERIVHIAFDAMRFDALREAPALHERIVNETPKEGPVYVLLDEIQEVDGWERVVNSLLADGRFDVWVTGSNSKLLSSELATYIAGRYVALDVSTLSFAEHRAFEAASGASREGDTEESFWKYVRRGGFPGVAFAGFDDAQAARAIADVYGSILIRDVLGRHRFRSPEMLERVALFALDNIGNPFSARRVADFLKSQRLSLNHQTVGEYLRAFGEAFVLTRMPRFDLRGREILATSEKYYAGDHGLVNALFGYSPSRLPGLLENIVQAELHRRGFDVFVGKVGEREVDFVAQYQDRRVYIQVTTTMAEATTRQRELAPLRALPDAYPKFVLSMDPLAGDVTEGIRHLRVPDFLLDPGWSA